MAAELPQHHSDWLDGKIGNGRRSKRAQERKYGTKWLLIPSVLVLWISVALRWPFYSSNRNLNVHEELPFSSGTPFTIPFVQSLGNSRGTTEGFPDSLPPALEAIQESIPGIQQIQNLLHEVNSGIPTVRTESGLKQSLSQLQEDISNVDLHRPYSRTALTTQSKHPSAITDSKERSENLQQEGEMEQRILEKLLGCVEWTRTELDDYENNFYREWSYPTVLRSLGTAPLPEVDGKNRAMSFLDSLESDSKHRIAALEITRQEYATLIHGLEQFEAAVTGYEEGDMAPNDARIKILDAAMGIGHE